MPPPTGSEDASYVQPVGFDISTMIAQVGLIDGGITAIDSTISAPHIAVSMWIPTGMVWPPVLNAAACCKPVL